MIKLSTKPAGVRTKRCTRCKRFCLPDGQGWRDVPELRYVHYANFDHTLCPPCRKQREATMDDIFAKYGRHYE